MFKKLAVFCLLISVVFIGTSFAATKAASVTGLGDVVAIGDGSSQDTAEVTSVGSIPSVKRTRAVSAVQTEGVVYSGACYLQSIHISGPTAGDYAMVYDCVTAATATVANQRFDPRISTNTRSQDVDCGGAPFATGIYVKPVDTDVLVTVVYDY